MPTKNLEAWQERVIKEHKELTEKVEKLAEFLRPTTFMSAEKGLDMDDYDILHAQLLAMKTYRSILNIRIRRFLGEQ